MFETVCSFSFFYRLNSIFYYKTEGSDESQGERIKVARVKNDQVLFQLLGWQKRTKTTIYNKFTRDTKFKAI